MKDWWRVLVGSFGFRKYYFNLSRSTEFAPFIVFFILAAIFATANGLSDGRRQQSNLEKALSSAPGLPVKIEVKNGALSSPEKPLSSRLGDLAVIIEPDKFTGDIPRGERPYLIVGQDGWIYANGSHESNLDFSDIKERTFTIPESLSGENAGAATIIFVSGRFFVAALAWLGLILLTLPFLFVIFALVLRERPRSWLAARVMTSAMIPFIIMSYAAQVLGGENVFVFSTDTHLAFALTGFFCVFLLFSTRGLALAILGERANSVPPPIGSSGEAG